MAEDEPPSRPTGKLALPSLPRAPAPLYLTRLFSYRNQQRFSSLSPPLQMFALAWNGSLGPETGKLLIGKDAIVEKSKHQSASPEAILRFDEYGWYQVKS